MSFSIVAGEPYVDDKGQLRMKMLPYDACPIEGGYSDCEVFLDKVRKTGDSIYFHDYWSPEFWHRATEYIYFAPDESVNTPLFKEWATWLKEHPNVWLNGYH